MDEPGTPGWALYVKPRAGETVLRKTTDDGFEGTALEGILAASRIRRLAIAGVMSEMCVSATARSAADRAARAGLGSGRAPPGVYSHQPTATIPAGCDTSSASRTMPVTSYNRPPGS